MYGGIHNEVYHPHGYTAALTQSIHDLCKLEDPDRYTVAVNGYGHADHPVNQNADIQGMNRYFGWYERKIQDIKPWIEKMEKRISLATPDADRIWCRRQYRTSDGNIGRCTELDKPFLSGNISN